MKANYPTPEIIKDVQVLHRAQLGPVGPRITRLQFVRIGDVVSVAEFWNDDNGRVARITSRSPVAGEL